ncbi:MAG: hypothetical protein RIR51_550 [Bacteroidota bacterium]
MNKYFPFLLVITLTIFIISCDSNENYDSQIVINKEEESDWKLASLAVKQFFIGDRSVINNKSIGKKINTIPIPLPKYQKIKENQVYPLFESSKYLNFSDLSISLNKDSSIKELIFDIYIERKNEMSLLEKDMEVFFEKRFGKPETLDSGMDYWEKNNTRIYMVKSDDHFDSGIRVLIRKN